MIGGSGAGAGDVGNRQACGDVGHVFLDGQPNGGLIRGVVSWAAGGATTRKRISAMMLSGSPDRWQPHAWIEGRCAATRPRISHMDTIAATYGHVNLWLSGIGTVAGCALAHVCWLWH
mmetsp:Transcript_64297/g.180987  ORF Transcript_64297/g.180987 Transcript_64297/m.180987 type:complete len:118 (-) Transcript_64297:200-553(-)